MINLRKVLKIAFINITFLSICAVLANASGTCLLNSIHLRVPINSVEVQKRIMALYDDQKHLSVTKKRLEELSILVPRLREELGRGPSMTEVVAEMENITGKTLAKKVATLSMWMKTNAWTPEQFGIQKFAYSPEPIESGFFRFGGLSFNTPNELTGKIIIRQPSGVRSEITELVLEEAQKPGIALKIRVLESGDFELRFGDKTDIIKRPADRTYISIYTLLGTPAFIAFRDSVLGIPVEFGPDRKKALLKFLQEYGSKDIRAAKENNVYMGNCWFVLPSYYRFGHGDKIVAYRDRENYINITALVEINNPGNFFIFEKRGDDFYSTESGEKLVSGGSVVGGRKIYYLKGFCRDFDAFNAPLDKIQRDKYYFSSLEETIRSVSIGRVRVNFWASVALSEDTIETQRTTPDEFDLFPVTLHRDKLKGEIVVRSYQGRKDAVTISGLNLKNGEPAILKGARFNLSVILEMIRLGKFEGLVTADKILTDTFYYRERPPQSGRLNPIRAYKFDKKTGTIEVGDSIHPRDLSLINIQTGRVDVPEQGLSAIKRLFSGV